MGIRDSFSRLKEKLDLKSTGRRRKPDGTGSGTDKERVGSLPRPEPCVVAGGGHDRAGGGSNADVRQVRPRDRLPRPDKPKSEPSDQEGGGVVVGGDDTQRHSNLSLGVEVAVRSGPGREWNGADGGKIIQIYPSPSIPSTIPHSTKSNSM